MEKRVINPWEWQDKFGYVQANEITDGKRVLYCAGQVSIDAEGRLVHADDMRAQLILALDNVEMVLKAAGFGLSNVVRLNYYTTDVEQLIANLDAIGGRLAEAECRYASTLLGVASLAFPQLLVEIEVTAVK
jgi:enamine deaminase RidA (YjgF/YER057c/UK114 family)